LIISKEYFSKLLRKCQGLFEAARKIFSGSFKIAVSQLSGTQTLQPTAMPPHSAITSAQPGPTAVTAPFSSTVTISSLELRQMSLEVVTASTG